MKKSPLIFQSFSDMSTFVNNCETAFESEVKQVIRAINKEGLRFVGLTGPTCSGKTTLAKKIIDYMERHGKRLCVISIDDFYFDRDVLLENARREGNDEIDFDSVKTIDIDAFEDVVEAIERGDSVSVPQYSFKTGRRESFKEIDPDSYDVFLFEGIQILYPEIYTLLKRHKYKTMYICVSEGISVGDTEFLPNEIRFMRRVVRDYYFRGAKGEFSYHLWESVRRNEDESIFPYVDNCEYRIDSCMPFEIGLLKPHLQRVLGEISETSKYYGEAQKILNKIDPIESVPRELLLEDSLYREFIPFE